MSGKWMLLLSGCLIGLLPMAAGQEKTGGPCIPDQLLFYLRNKNNCTATFSCVGARLVSLHVPDRYGKIRGVVLGFDSTYDYITGPPTYFGATVGRYANRIAGASFTLHDSTYQLPVNSGINFIHGGPGGFHSRIWAARQIDDHRILFSYLSKDGEEGFPGNLSIQVIYELTDDNALSITYEASTDKPTVLNVTNHAFFNLNGEGSGTIEQHWLRINARRYLPVDSNMIPLGKMAYVRRTPFDFRSTRRIGEHIGNDHPQLSLAKGYDHNFVLDGKGWRSVATAAGDQSGIVMDVWTTEPGLQLYTTNLQQGKNKLRSGPDLKRSAFCLETQHFPDAPHHRNFPSTVLLPGTKFHSRTTYRFTVMKAGNYFPG